MRKRRFHSSAGREKILVSIYLLPSTGQKIKLNLIKTFLSRKNVDSAQRIALELSRDRMENSRGGEERGETNAVIVRGRRKYLTKFQGAFVAVKSVSQIFEGNHN